MQLRLLAAVALTMAALAASPATALNFSFTGSFSQDDDVQLFSFTLGTGGGITVRTLSYGGGTNAALATIDPGGFDPIVSLFANGELINLNNDAGGCGGGLSNDPVTGACWDSLLTTVLPAGDYVVALTQHDNLPLGPFLSDGFLRDGQGNFTGPAFIGAPGSFIDANPAQRSNEWALDILDVDGAAVVLVPEPASLWLVGAVGLLLAARRR